MTIPDPHVKASRRELRMTLLRMRLEMHRQELRHETLVMLQPLRRAQHWRKELRNSSAPLWATAGALLLTTVGARNGHWRRWLRIALVAFPLLRRNPPRPTHTTPETSKDASAEA